MGYGTEQWTEYSIGMVVFLLRFFARWKVVGMRGLSWDDSFIFIAMILWTVDSVTVQIINDNGSIVGLNEETAALLSDEEAARIKLGSQALFVAWISYVTLIWSLKASLLVFYSRLTLGLWQQKFIKIMAVVCVVAYVAVVLVLFLHCTPIERNWQAKPYPGDKCAITVANYLVVASFNVITDAGILAIPLPLVWKVQIPLARKIVIGILLSSGVFVITAALLRCVLSLISVANIGNSTIWGIRETFVSLIAISAPAIKPLFNRNRLNGRTGDKNTGQSGPYRRFNDSKSVGVATIGSKGASLRMQQSNDLEASNSIKNCASNSDAEMDVLSTSESNECIVRNNEMALEVQVTTVVSLSDDRSSTLTKTLEELRNKNEDAKQTSNPFRSGTAFVDDERSQRGNITQISVGHTQTRGKTGN